MDEDFSNPGSFQLALPESIADTLFLTHNSISMFIAENKKYTKQQAKSIPKW